MNWDVDIYPRVCGAWIELLPVLSMTRRYEMALSSSVKALAVSILSRGRNGIAPISDALTAHCSALHSLHESLHHIAHTADSDVLAVAIMCLMISEVRAEPVYLLYTVAPVPEKLTRFTLIAYSADCHLQQRGSCCRLKRLDPAA